MNFTRSNISNQYSTILVPYGKWNTRSHSKIYKWHQKCVLDEALKSQTIQLQIWFYAAATTDVLLGHLESCKLPFNSIQRYPSYNMPTPPLRIFLFSSLVLLSSNLLPSHILCLWLSLDFSQMDKLISFIHTWSFSLLSPRLDPPTLPYPPTPHNIPFPSSWLAIELCFMKTV